MTADHKTIVFGRELAMDYAGSNMLFQSRADAEDFPCITVALVGGVNRFSVWKLDDADNLIPADWDDIEYHVAQHEGRNQKLIFKMDA